MLLNNNFEKYSFIKQNDPDRLEFVNKINKKLIANTKEPGVIEHICAKSLDEEVSKTVEQIDVSVKKLTAFHPNPTKEQVDYVLSEKAKTLNANAVRNVKYSSGVGFTTWGYMDAKGDASKCDLK